MRIERGGLSNKMEELRYTREDVRVLETAIDDMNPEFYPYIIERLLEEGALDAYLKPVIMKKGRPGVMLTVLLRNNNQDTERLLEVILTETTSLGVRVRTEQRFCLHRGFATVQTPYGQVRVKAAFTADSEKPARYVPEFEDCKALAREKGVPLRQVYNAALVAAEQITDRW